MNNRARKGKKMKMRLYGIALGMLIGLQGCAQKQVKKEKSALIVWKSPQFRYADMGFIADEGNRLKVEIYGSGSALMRLKIDQDSICMSQLRCMPKAQFNKKALSSHYPATLLESVFRGEPVFDGRNLARRGSGFTQRITSPDHYDIFYEVDKNQITFRDKYNHLLIKIKETI